MNPWRPIDAFRHAAQRLAPLELFRGRLVILSQLNSANPLPRRRRRGSSWTGVWSFGPAAALSSLLSAAPASGYAIGRLLRGNHVSMSRSSSVKIVYLVTKRPDLDDEAFIRHWTTVHAALASRMPHLLVYSINTPSSRQRGIRPFDGYAMLKFDTYEGAKAAWRSSEGRATALDGEEFMVGPRALIVDEHIVVPHRYAETAIKIVFLVTKRPALGDDEFIEQWMSVHTDLGRRLPGLTGYSINTPSAAQRGPRPFDGYAVMRFPSYEEAVASLHSTEADALAADRDRFIVGTEELIVDERPVVARDA